MKRIIGGGAAAIVLHAATMATGPLAWAADVPASNPASEAKPAAPGKTAPGLRREVLDAYASLKGVVKYQTDIDPIVKRYIKPELTLAEAKRLLESSGFTVVQFQIPPTEHSKYQSRLVGCICNVDTRPYLRADIIVVIQFVADKAIDVSGKIVVPDS